jgi:hypothetical protein
MLFGLLKELFLPLVRVDEFAERKRREFRYLSLQGEPGKADVAAYVCG